MRILIFAVLLGAAANVLILVFAVQDRNPLVSALAGLTLLITSALLYDEIRSEH